MADISSLFGELTKNVQIRIDKASELQKRLFDEVLYTKFLDWDNPTIGLDFEELVGKYNITVAAPTIGDGSKEPILQTEGLEVIKKSVTNHVAANYPESWDSVLSICMEKFDDEDSSENDSLGNPCHLLLVYPG